MISKRQKKKQRRKLIAKKEGQERATHNNMVQRIEDRIEISEILMKLRPIY